MQSIAITSRKGGVGKTTTAVHLAAGLADTGVRVLLIDIDVQGHVARILGVNPAAGCFGRRAAELYGKPGLLARRIDSHENRDNPKRVRKESGK